MKGYVPQSFGEYNADDYDMSFKNPPEDDTLQTVDVLADLAAGGAILELAIGTGRAALPLTAKGFPVRGIQASTKMVQKLREKPDGDAIDVTIGDMADVGVEGPMHFSFDFDYTLADSSDGTVACANYALAALNLQPCSISLIKESIGLSLEKTFEFLFGSESSSRTAAEFKYHFLAQAEQVMLAHIHFYAGTRITLDSLKRDGHYISIVSTKFKKRIEEALERDALAEFIDDIVGGDCVQKNKPDPAGLLLAMQTSGIAADRTIYVGDSVSDGECARRAGVAFIGVLSGTTPATQLNKWNPCLLLDSVEGLADVEERGLL